MLDRRAVIIILVALAAALTIALLLPVGALRAKFLDSPPLASHPAGDLTAIQSEISKYSEAMNGLRAEVRELGDGRRALSTIEQQLSTLLTAKQPMPAADTASPSPSASELAAMKSEVARYAELLKGVQAELRELGDSRRALATIQQQLSTLLSATQTPGQFAPASLPPVVAVLPPSPRTVPRSIAALKVRWSVQADGEAPVTVFEKTTGPGIPRKFREVLRTYAAIDENAQTDYGAAAAVRQMEERVGWNGTTSNFVNRTLLEALGFKETPQNPLADGFDELDIVVPSIRDLDFLEDWKEFFFGYHIIIIQDGDPSKVLKIPPWADYELYNREDIKRALGDDHWIISSRDASIRNFGFLVSKKKYVYTIDDDCLPAPVNGKLDHPHRINVVKQHLRNLRSPSAPYFFNTLYDAYRPGADYVRGYPYSLRAGVPTAVSHGLWLNAPDYDAPTQLLKVEERNRQLVDATITIPAGVLYPMCSMNVAFNRELIGPAFMQGLMGDGQPWARYDDMFAGWASKTVADHLHLGTKSGAPYIWHNKASNPFTNLKKEYKGLFWQEEVIDFFDNVALSPSAVTPTAAYRELAGLIRRDLVKLHPYFDRLATAMERWVDAWEKAQAGQLTLVPSRRSKSSDYRYAALTIVKNEPVFLPLWLRHYRQSFAAEDIFVITNGGNDTIPEAFGAVNLWNRSCTEYFDHACIIKIVQAAHEELLARGYRSVLFSEADELVFARGGSLRAVLDSNRYPSMRATAYTLFHNKTGDPRPFDFDNADVLSQRTLWFRESMYDKPFVTAVPYWMTYGFHASFSKQTGELADHRDERLLMVHLQRADYDYFIRRGEWKARQNLHSDVKAGQGFQHALTGQKLIDFYNDARGAAKRIPQDMVDAFRVKRDQ